MQTSSTSSTPMPRIEVRSLRSKAAPMPHTLLPCRRQRHDSARHRADFCRRGCPGRRGQRRRSGDRPPASASPPDIVLADIGMPGKSGYEVAQHAPVASSRAYSGHAAHRRVRAGGSERAAAAGCDGVLAKPFEPQIVIARVKELLARKRPAGAAVPPAPHAPDHQWAPPPAEPPPAAPPAAPEPLSLDDYFDRLDAAFSNKPSANAAPPQARPAAGSGPGDRLVRHDGHGSPEPHPADPPAAQAEPPLAPLTYAHRRPPEAPALVIRAAGQRGDGCAGRARRARGV